MSPSHKRILVFIISLLIAISLGLPFVYKALNKVREYEVDKTQFLMGTVVEIKAEGEDRDRLLKAIDDAFLEMKRLEKMMSHYTEESEVSAIEKGAPEWVRVSPEMLDVLEESIRISELSRGAFDITVGGLAKLWSFDEGKERIPAQKEIEALLPFVSYRYIEVNRERSSVRLTKKGVRLTLGGIGKGYIVDRAMDVIRSYGIKDALINAGGDMKAIRSKGKEGWRIGVQHPRQRGKILAVLKITNASIATSGDYERYFIKDGARYHHILNPRSGMPAEGAQSVTIIAPNAYYSDALATAVFVLGVERGKALIESLRGIEGIIVDKDGKVWVSSGLEGDIELVLN